MSWTWIEPTYVLILIGLFGTLAGHSCGTTVQERQSVCTGNNLTVDLGYAIYQGFHAGNGLNGWNKIRYAAPPTGTSRWQLPKTPETNRSTVMAANSDQSSYSCPQSFKAPFFGDTCGNLKNSSTVAPGCNQILYSEDCLFLNVFAPQNSTNLPVLVWIHGGGYGKGNGAIDLGSIINANGRSFVAVSIQYRLGAFGFLSSAALQSHGVSNAGLYDQQFALQWVQNQICKFGGDSSKVTIMGQSAGAGSVITQIAAMNGTLNTTLFQNTILSSPFVSQFYKFKDAMPTALFKAFALEVGCNKTVTAFKCLQKKGSAVLQVASNRISASGYYGTWAFMPVIDGQFLTQNPIRQLSVGNMNGERVLTGNVANEGNLFTAQNATSDSAFGAFAKRMFPFANQNQLLITYPSPGTSSSAPLFATTGDEGPTALNQSSFATGQQQRANNVLGEAILVCPSYWVADAFAQAGRASYKYQFSVPLASHTFDIGAYFKDAPAPTYMNADFELAVMQMIGNFTVNNDPSIANLAANGASQSNPAPNPASSWPPWTPSQKPMLNLNTTNGTATTTTFVQPGSYITGIPINVNPGLMNDFSVVDGAAWEGGRGARCDFWRQQYTS